MAIRLAVRALIVQNDHLLLVNAFPDGQSDLWCAPGGGVEPGASLPENLMREIYEETGLGINVGAPCLVNEFHNPDDTFHQVEIFFRCTITSGTLRDNWHDTGQIVTKRRFFSRTQMAQLHFKPDRLPDIAFSDRIGYDPLEILVK